MNDRTSAVAWRTIRELGMKNQNDRLWNGEYYIQLPGVPSRIDYNYNKGCHSDQLLGQWWAHMLNLGYLYPCERVLQSLRSVMRYNFKGNFKGFKQHPRRYVMDDDGGLLMCSWPKNGRPDPFIIYADEVWTGIEYAVAGAMIYEDLLDDARTIVKTVRARYNGCRRDGLNSGPGGNPFNELECGKFYARAMSSWGLLIASQGLILDGPTGLMGFKPAWQPENHRSFFSASEGWGIFIQNRSKNRQVDRIELRHGRLRLRQLVFSVSNEGGVVATVKVNGKTVEAKSRISGNEVWICFDQTVEVPVGGTVEVEFRKK